MAEGAEVMLVFDDRVGGPGDSAFGARVCGRKLADAHWEGWIEFAPAGGDGAALRTGRETLQPSRRDLVYWATGLTHTFLEGALARALAAADAPGSRARLGRGPGPRKPVRARPGRPAAHGEREVSPGRAGRRATPLPAHAVLDPFEVYAQGDELLRQELGALSAQHLRLIARAFGLTTRSPEELERLSAAELEDEIFTRVRERFARGDGASPSASVSPAE
ncbi:MAG TPA: hypothetical protein VFZ11_01065 [Gemmatimonadaceae bacterium]